MTSVRRPGARDGRPVAPRAGVLAAVTITAAAAGAIAGVLTAPEADAPPPLPAPAPPAVLEAGAVRLSAPPGWAPGEPRFRLTGLDADAGMAAGDAAAVLAVRAPDDPSLLPAELVERAGRALVAADARAGAGAWRYELSSPGTSDRMTVVVAPSTLGVVTLACLAPGDASARCARAASTLALARGAWLRAAPEAAARIALPATLARLNARRRAARAALADARRAQGRRRAARGLATAYGEAARALAPVAAGSAGRLPAMLRALAADHRALARAHASGRRAAAIRAGAAIDRREQRLAAQLEVVGRGD